MIGALRPGLTVKRIARIFRHSETLTRRMLKKYGYAPTKAAVGEPGKAPPWARQVDWNERNSVIALQVGRSREAVRQMRKKLGRKKVGKCGVQSK